MRLIDHRERLVRNCPRVVAAFLAAIIVTVTAGAAETDDPFARSDFPRWSGPNDDLHATSRGIELVDDLQNVRMLWRSEAVIHGAHANRSHRELEHLPASGGSSPIVHQGKVYHFYYELTGEKVVAMDDVANVRARLQPAWARRAGADDVMLCVDAASGRTVWKRVLEPSVNLQISKSPIGVDGLIDVVIGSAREPLDSLTVNTRPITDLGVAENEARGAAKENL
ncbi:MAG: hypothetical protein ACOCZK_07940 [Planctomycetota bacterium]